MDLSVAQLRRAAALKERMAKLQKEVDRILVAAPPVVKRRKRRKLSAAARARISAFQKARWAKLKAGQKK
jgi:hypothetical protein